MPQHKRTEAHLRAEREYRKKRKRIILDWHLEKDAELLEWLRQQVTKDSELPALIKRLLKETIK